MKKLETEDFLGIYGAKRAAEGIILSVGDNTFLHLRDIINPILAKGLSDKEKSYLSFCSKKEILRLRGLRNSHDYLLRFRANAIVDSPRAVRVMAARRKIVESSGRHWTLMEYYHSKDHYHKSYIDYLNRPQAEILKKIPAGLAFLSEANALSTRSFLGDVVFASESLEHFYYFMSIGFFGHKFGIKLIDRAISLLIAIRIMEGAESLDFDIDPRVNLPIETERSIQALVKNQMQFTFGHEYAHLLCEHLSSPQEYTASVSTNLSGTDLNNLLVYNHELEYEADYYALKNIQHNEKAFNQVIEGAIDVLLFLHFLQEMQNKLGLKKFLVSLTHPEAFDRMQRLIQKLGNKIPEAEKILTNCSALSTEMAEILMEFLKDYSDEILSFYGAVYLTSISKLKIDRYDSSKANRFVYLTKIYFK